MSFEKYNGLYFCNKGTCSDCNIANLMITIRTKQCIDCRKIYESKRGKKYLQKRKENPDEYQAFLAKKRAYARKQAESGFLRYDGYTFCDCGTCSICGKTDLMITRRTKRCVDCTRFIECQKSKIAYEKSKPKELHLCLPAPIKSYGSKFSNFGACSECGICPLLITPTSKRCINCVKTREIKKRKIRFAIKNPKLPELHLCVPIPITKYGKIFCKFGACSKCGKNNLITRCIKECIDCSENKYLRQQDKNSKKAKQNRKKLQELHLCIPHAFKKYGRKFNKFGSCSKCDSKYVMITPNTKECIECAKIKYIGRYKKCGEKRKRPPLYLCLPPPIKRFSKNFCDYGICLECGNGPLLITELAKHCIECVRLKVNKRSRESGRKKYKKLKANPKAHQAHKIRERKRSKNRLKQLKEDPTKQQQYQDMLTKRTEIRRVKFKELKADPVAFQTHLARRREYKKLKQRGQDLLIGFLKLQRTIKHINQIKKDVDDEQK